jgi:hypothetical protein
MELSGQRCFPSADRGAASLASLASRTVNAADVDAAHWEILRRMGMAGRARLTFALSDALRELSESGVRRRHPDYDDRKVRLGAIKLAIGAELFREVFPSEDVDP